MINEVYKDIKDYEELYQVSNLGNIKSLISNKLLKFGYSHNGYRLVNLKGKMFR